MKYPYLSIIAARGSEAVQYEQLQPVAEPGQRAVGLDPTAAATTTATAGRHQESGRQQLIIIIVGIVSNNMERG